MGSGSLISNWLTHPDHVPRWLNVPRTGSPPLALVVVLMNEEFLASVPNPLNSHLWRCSRFQGDATSEALWLPVMDLHGHGLSIGLTDDGRWVIESVDGLVPLRSEPGIDSLLECLYHPRAEIVNRLNNSIEAVGLPVAVFASFPFLELVAHALDFSPFYADLALEWLEEGSLGQEFLPLLQGVADADEKRFPEVLRHRATQLCRQIRGGLTEP